MSGFWDQCGIRTCVGHAQKLAWFSRAESLPGWATFREQTCANVHERHRSSQASCPHARSCGLFAVPGERTAGAAALRPPALPRAPPCPPFPPMPPAAIPLSRPRARVLLTARRGVGHNDSHPRTLRGLEGAERCPVGTRAVGKLGVPFRGGRPMARSKIAVGSVALVLAVAYFARAVFLPTAARGGGGETRVMPKSE